MKKIVLITTLIFSLVISLAYAEDMQPEKSREDTYTKTAATKFSTATASMATMSGGVPDASPGGGITGSMMPFLSESFQTDLATGAATLNIPITVPPGRKNMQPNLSLSYSSNNSNGICGVGWAIPSNLIQRSTKRGIPNYDNTDIFMFISSGSNAELVDIGNNEYRAKLESGFMKYVFSNNIWTVYDKSGTKYIFGYDTDSRLSKPGDNNIVFSWYLYKVEDVYGNYLTYIYQKPQDGQIYLKEIHYTGGANLTPDKKIVFNYDDRNDKLYSYRSGWKIATSKILSSIDVLLNNERVWLYELTYKISEDTGRNLLERITVKDKSGNSLPPKTFTYQTLD